VAVQALQIIPGSSAVFRRRSSASADAQRKSLVLRQFFMPSAHSIGFSSLEADSIDSGYTAVGKASPPRLGQNIRPTEFVIEHVKPITRISLRFGMQRFLQLPELKWRR
jgi:hypothetical protein